MKITIKDRRNNILLITDSESYKSDLKKPENVEKVQREVFVEYGEKKDWRYWEDYSLPYKNERAVINVNGRLVFADWNKERLQGCNGYGVERETIQQHVNSVIEFLNTDFNTTKEVVIPYNRQEHEKHLNALIKEQEKYGIQ